MFPSHLDGRSHIVSQDDGLRRPPVVKCAKPYDVHLSHSSRKIARKSEENKGAGVHARLCPYFYFSPRVRSVAMAEAKELAEQLREYSDEHLASG
jgi:hypothetical protein